MEFPLSEKGRAQATLAGQALANKKLDAIYSSPLSRAFETAKIIAREVGFRGEVIPVTELMERRGGLLEGTTQEEREARNPELMKKFLSIPEEERWTLVGAETDEEVLARFEVGISKIRERHGTGDRIAVVSHGGAMRAFLRDLFGPEMLSGDQRVPNTSITSIEWSPDGSNSRLLALASIAHLPQ
jgi:broad specificity phosphatase PhoE